MFDKPKVDAATFLAIYRLGVADGRAEMHAKASLCAAKNDHTGFMDLGKGIPEAGERYFALAALVESLGIKFSEVSGQLKPSSTVTTKGS